MTNDQLKQKEHKAKIAYNRFLFGVIFIPFIVLGFKKAYETTPPKTYTVTLSLDEWRSVLQAEDSTRRVFIKSNLPTNETNYCIQSSYALTQTISTQVSAQITAETKKDSTNSVKTKNK